MPEEIWKEFEHNEISHSVAHHLTAINELTVKNGYARVSDVAKHLSITRGSASLTLKALKQRGLVGEDGNKFLKLSDEGQRIVDIIEGKRRIFRKFLEEVLKVGYRQAEVDACKVEHLLSVETGGNLLHFLRFLLANIDQSKEFLDAFWSKDDVCDDPKSCPVCIDNCLMKLQKPSSC
ncbi:MAG: metal-dependent transcriptional regulator [Candidatus Latescibacterota bacterium]|nr:metal-dependent transcriptional regulator [Candidatus Latescibacterota bacterium]